VYTVYCKNIGDHEHMTQLKDTLKDILKHTHGLGIFEMVRITGTKESTGVETVDSNKTVIMKAVTNKPVPEFVDSVIGLRVLGVLDGYLKFHGFDTDGGSLSITTQDRNGVVTPFGAVFKSKDGTLGDYRFAIGAVLDQQMASIDFKGATYKVEIVPTPVNITDLGWFNSTLSLTDMTFTPRTNGTTLTFDVGDGSSDSAKIVINNNITGSLSTERQWPLDIVLKILKLSNTSSSCVLSINDKLMQIKISSGLGEYTYLIPPKQ